MSRFYSPILAATKFYQEMAAAHALELFLAGNVTDAIREVEDLRREQDEQGYFDAVCVRASIAALMGEGHATVAKILSRAPGANSAEKAAGQYVEGVAALSRSNMETAKLKFEEAIRSDDTFMLAHLGLGAVYFHKQDFRSSFSQYRVVLEKLGSQSPPIARIGLGLAAYRLGEIKHARLCLERALKVHPDDVIAITALIVLYLRLRLMKQVTELVTKLQTLAPENIVALQKFADLVYLKYVQKPTAATAKTMRRLLDDIVIRPEITPTQLAYSRFQQGRLEHAVGHYDAACALYDESLKELPDLIAAKTHKAKALFRLGRRDECQALLEEIDSKHEHEKDVLEMLAVIYSDKGYHQVAMKYAHRLTASVGQGDPQSWALHAWCSRLDTAAALRLMKHYAKLEEAAEGKPAGWQLRANIAALEGDAATLKEIIHEKADLGPNFLEHEQIGIDSAALVYNYALALETVDENHAAEVHAFLVKVFPSAVQSYIRLHQLALKQNKTKKAMAWLGLLSQTHPEDELVESYAASFFFSQGRQFLGTNLIRLSTKKKTLPNGISLGIAYLWAAQQPSGTSTHLVTAFNRLKFVLTEDPGNILAAHALSCLGSLAGNPLSAQEGLESVGEVIPNDDYVRENWNLHMGNISVQNGSFKQAVDYYGRHETPVPAIQALCHASDGNFDKAESTMELALTQSTDPFERQMLQYNYAIILFADVLSSTADVKALPEEKGRELGRKINRGLMLAADFAKIKDSDPANASRIRRYVRFLRGAANYCRGVHEGLNQLMSRGRRDEMRSRQQQEEWRQTLERKKRERQADDEQAKAEEELRRMENVEQGNSLYQSFLQRRTETQFDEGDMLPIDELDEDGAPLQGINALNDGDEAVLADYLDGLVDGQPAQDVPPL